MLKGCVCFASLIGLHAVVLCQSFNVDLDIGIGDQQGGNGAPSSAFGAAAGSPGYWNRIYAGGPSQPVNLHGLDGSVSQVQLQATGGLGISEGYDNFANAGDYALLLNDFATPGWSGQDFEIDYHLTGLQPGRYKIYTYAVDPRGMTLHTAVTIPGADDPTRYVTGPMPGNQLIEGVTHSVHDLTLAGDSFVIQVHGSPPYEYNAVNGFQIVSVPEPASLLAFGGAAALLIRRKRQR